MSEQSIRQLRERITHNFELAALTQDEIHNYLNFRMREVGYTGPELINTAVAKKVEQHSEGLLRRINIIADKILLSAFAEGTHNLTSKHVTAAVNDSAFNQESPRSKSRIFWWLGLLAVIALLFALYQSRAQWMATLAVDLPPKQENAVKNDNPITDIAPQAIETDLDKAQVDTTTDSDPEPTIEQPVAVAEVIQTEVAVQQENETLKQQDDAVVPADESAVQPVEVVVQEEVKVVVQEENDMAQAEAINAPVEEDRILQNALDQAASSVALATEKSPAPGLTADYDRWLNAKLQQSRDWLSQANRNSVSIQVFVRSKSAVRELVYYLRNEWPLDLSETYLYEVNTEGRGIYRVFYSEFDSLSRGRSQLERLPESVKRNSPYLHSVYRMQKALL